MKRIEIVYPTLLFIWWLIHFDLVSLKWFWCLKIANEIGELKANLDEKWKQKVCNHRWKVDYWFCLVFVTKDVMMKAKNQMVNCICYCSFHFCQYPWFFVEWTFICEKLLWKMNRIWTWKHFVIWCNCEWIDIEFIASKCEMFWLLESMWNAKTVWSDGRNNELDVHKLWLLVKCFLFLFILSFHIQNTL